MFDGLTSRRAHVLKLALAVLLTSCYRPLSVNPTPQSSTTSVPAAQIAPVPVSEIDTHLNTLVHLGSFSGSVLIARNGEVLLSKGYGFADREQKSPNTPKTKFRLGSITKPFTAMAIIILEAQGKLDVQDHICSYLSECPEAWEAITIHHLLTHTSGIPNFTDFPDYRRTSATPSPPEETINRFKDKPLDFRPGESWSYSNSGYILLGQIIERVSSQSYEAFLQEHIFTPLQMTDTGYDHNQDDLAVGYKDIFSKADFIDMSIPYAAGGLYSTVEDLYRWDQAFYTKQLLQQDYIDQIFAAHVAIPNSDGMAYGYGWIIGLEDSRQIITHGGGINGFVTNIARYPQDKTVIIILSNQQYTSMGIIPPVLAKKVFRGR
jgi:CubicO group peptidase (beta-lactamase class C family)